MDAVNHIQLVSVPSPCSHPSTPVVSLHQPRTSLTTPIQTLVSSQVKPILRALLYAIFFHRTLDNIEPETYEIGEAHVVSAALPFRVARGGDKY